MKVLKELSRLHYITNRLIAVTHFHQFDSFEFINFSCCQFPLFPSRMDEAFGNYKYTRHILTKQCNKSRWAHVPIHYILSQSAVTRLRRVKWSVYLCALVRMRKLALSIERMPVQSGA